MFSNIWHKPVHGDRSLSDKSRLLGGSPPRSPLAPVAQLPLFNKMKRKREESNVVTPISEQPAHKKRAETLSHIQIPRPSFDQLFTGPPAPVASSVGQSMSSDPTGESQLPEQLSSVAPVVPSSAAKGPTSTSTASTMSDPRLRLKPSVDIAEAEQVIESQFNLEILYKHRELRLIDQELAKCEIALEQLRRCQVIPYPTNYLHPPESSLVYNNTASEAPRWGVTDGPYTRHLQKWLLQDSAFDDSFVEPPSASATPTSGKYLPERSTRGTHSDKTVMAASSSRAQRGLARSAASSAAHSNPHEEKGPMIVKRSSDSHMVKLVCLDCRRSDFSSTQGFINHCRIAHSRQFVSHDAAIEASGEELDGTENNPTDSSGARGAPASAGLVHPLIRSAHLLASSTTGNNNTSGAAPSPKGKQKAGSDASKTSTATTPSPSSRPPLPTLRNAPPLQHPSPQTPHLSALLARLGRQVNLEALVEDATTRPESDSEEDSDEEMEDADVAEPQEPERPSSRSTRGVVRSSTPSVPPDSSAMGYDGQFDQPPKPTHPHPSPLSLGRRQSLTADTESSSFSPNTTDSHPAPSLVSDDGDHETTHSDSEGPFSSDEHEPAHHYLDTEMIGHDGMDLDDANSVRLGPGAGKPRQHVRHGPEQPTPTVRRRSRPSAMAHQNHVHHGERHVTFASLSTDSEKDMS